MRLRARFLSTCTAVIAVTVSGLFAAPPAGAVTPLGTTAIIVTASGGALRVGDTTKVTATITPEIADPQPTLAGVITFRVDGEKFKTVSIVTGQASATTPKFTSVGSYTITAQFVPSGADYSASSASMSRTVIRVPAAVSLRIGPSLDVAAGVRVRLHAKVRPAVAGIVKFTDRGAKVGSAKVREGRAMVILRPTKGFHFYRASFKPTNAAKYATALSAERKLGAGAAKSFPFGRGAFGPLVHKVSKYLVWSGVKYHRFRTFGAAAERSVARFQGKFFLPATGAVDQRTWRVLKSVADRKLPRLCTRVHKAICVDKTRKVAQLVIDGKVVQSLDARFGSTSVPGLATREGLFSIQRKDADHISSQFKTPMPYSMFFSGGQAIHYSMFFAADGYSGASHGCVNTRSLKGVKRMYNHSPIGTRVYVYRS